MKTLLDTCVLTELRKPEGHPAVKPAVAEIPDADLYLSVLTVGEIAKGIGLLAAGRKKKALTSWLTGLETKFGDRILAIDDGPVLGRAHGTWPEVWNHHSGR